MEKIAIIDIGSNTARLVIANILEGGYFVVVDELKEPVRLAQDMEMDGFLRPIRIQQMVRTLKTFKNLYESHNVNKVYAYGTAAVRRAKNQKSFVEEILSNCGIKLEVLTQEKEALLVYTGVINSMDIPKGMIVDIGGASTKIIYYNRRIMLTQESLPFGAVTLTDKFAPFDGTPAEKAETITQYVMEELKKMEWLPQMDLDTQLIGVGGSIRNLGRISRKINKYPLDMAHNYHVGFDEFSKIYDSVTSVSVDAKARIKGLSSARADIFPAAMCIVEAIRRSTVFSEIIVGGAGFREGVMINHAMPSTLEKPINDVLGHSIYTLIEQFDINKVHAEHVFDLSLQLYRQLRVVHKLPRPYVKVLRVAAYLHDIGSSFKFYDHHKHSFYFILNSNLYGISQRGLVAAAFVAGLHTKGTLEGNDILQYASILTEEDLDAVKKLGVIVRIAECFDRSMSGVITGLSSDVLGESVILKTESISDCTLEIKDAMGALGDFKKSFKKNLEIL